MTGFEEVGDPAVWLINVEPSVAQALARVASGLRLRLSLASDLSAIPSGAFVVLQCGSAYSQEGDQLQRWLASVEHAYTVTWVMASDLVPSSWLERLLQSGVTDTLALPSSSRVLVHRFKLLLELWQRRRLEARERLALQGLRHEHDQILSQLEEGVLVLDRDGCILDANNAATEWLVCPREQLLGTHVARLLTGPRVEDPLLDWCEHSLFHPIMQAEPVRLDDTQFWRADGEALPVACRLQPLDGVTQGRMILVFSDITVRKAEEALVDQLTRYDAVTGLANAPLMRHFLLKAMARALRNDRLLAVLYVDLDDFGCINDSFGRKAGNQLLRSVGRRLRGCIRTGDLVSRYHEDTFIIVLDEVRSEEDAERIAEQILQKLVTPHDVGAQIVVHASIGLAFYPSQSIGIDTLLQRAADAAMQVKAQGKNNYRRYSNEETPLLNRSLSEFH